MDNNDASNSQNSFTKEAEVAQAEEQREQPWKEAMDTQASAKASVTTAADGAHHKTPDNADDTSMDMVMTS
jgi:hypothetical protein